MKKYKFGINVLVQFVLLSYNENIIVLSFDRPVLLTIPCYDM